QFPRHFHDHYTILLVEEGVNEGFTGRQQYRVGPGGLLVINPGDLHAGNSLDGQLLKFSSLRLEREFFEQFFTQQEQALCGDLLFGVRPIYHPSLAAGFRGLLGAMQAEATLATDQLLSTFFADLLYQQSNQALVYKAPKDHPAVRHARDYIHAHFDESISLEMLSKVALLSPYHLIRSFKQFYGLTPFQYLRNLRIEKAKPLLRHQSIARVAHAVGFFDQSHFLKNFKKIEGVPPSQFR
ncbi:MAG: AraC family transcriptional regulator, partial [Phaeodactylibacter sp.]|nr:AraC family transcriptional regulator [Phaeodactylibacter sp.]